METSRVWLPPCFESFVEFKPESTRYIHYPRSPPNRTGLRKSVESVAGVRADSNTKHEPGARKCGLSVLPFRVRSRTSAMKTRLSGDNPFTGNPTLGYAFEAVRDGDVLLDYGCFQGEFIDRVAELRRATCYGVDKNGQA